MSVRGDEVRLKYSFKKVWSCLPFSPALRSFHSTIEICNMHGCAMSKTDMHLVFQLRNDLLKPVTHVP